MSLDRLLQKKNIRKTHEINSYRSLMLKRLQTKKKHDIGFYFRASSILNSVVLHEHILYPVDK